MTTTKNPTPEQRSLALVRRAALVIGCTAREADAIASSVRSSIYALLPGKQNREHVQPALHTACKAVARQLRRRAKARG